MSVTLMSSSGVLFGAGLAVDATQCLGRGLQTLGAISMSRSYMCSFDLDYLTGIRLHAYRRRTLSLGIVATLRDAQHLEQGSYRVVM